VLGDVYKRQVFDRSAWANGEYFTLRTLKNQLDLALLIVKAALNREESRGTHYKPEMPRRDDENWLVITKARYKQEGPEFDYSEKVEVIDIKPVERNYG
jgi:succinate dehydrogenase / fumarate reductase flavoprotein subunit